MLHWDIQKTQPLKLARPLGKKFVRPVETPVKVKLNQNVNTKPPKEESISFNDNADANPIQEVNLPKTLVVFVAHIWNDDINSYYTTLKQSCTNFNIDLVILACGPRYDSQEKIFRPSLEEIKQMYPKNFHAKGLWACNHWILLWLWKFWAKEQYYDHVWSIEYDVRTLGDLNTLWALDRNIDYVSTTAIQQYNTEGFWGPNSGFKPTHTALKQIFRCSFNFLTYLDEKCMEGLTGQDECTLATHAQSFKHSNLKQYLCSGFSPQKNENVFRLWQNEKKKQIQILKIFHPIK